ncbi:rhodanese-related sulfurtransferase [Methylophilaceae bacterium]|nr:rhodanese-related sulfurtransferase [Methylophilaceae bacterium]
MFLTIAFYQFVSLENINQLQAFILKFCQKNSIKGTILLASEGINGTISGEEEKIKKFIEFIKEDSFFMDNFKNLEHKESWASENPFYRMKVRLKKEIVALGVDGISPTKKVGEYVKPEDWNKLINDPNTIVIDTRNNYEIDIGTFKNSINPKTETFREFPSYVEKNLKDNKQKKVAMFCTGGIRCEKATSLMLNKGFENVYHLKGGILKYLETIPKDKSLWQGECFVFDQRVAVTHGLDEGQYNQCYACRHPLSPEELESNQYTKGISCPYCFNKLSDKKKGGVIERQKQIMLSKSKGENHIGDNQNKAKENL